MPIKADKSLRAYYNEIDPSAAQWIRNLMAEGWITKGDVDERSIEDVRPNELAGYDRLHFFAGIAVWDFALNQAGWGRGEIWTGSCPCQPFSAAGAGAGFDDERHLWPAFHHLVKECRPAVVLGEQVASKDANPWIDLVQADLEALDYRVGAIAFPAAGVGAPHIRDRLYWVADADGARREGQHLRAGRGLPQVGIANIGGACGLADHLMQQRPDGEPGICYVDEASGRDQGAAAAAGFCSVGRLGHPDSESTGRNSGAAHTTEAEHGAQRSNGDGPWDASKLLSRGEPPAGPVNGFWRAADWLGCRDGKWRPVEPGTFPLVAGAAARVVRLRAYGNAINSAAAQAFIQSVMEAA